MTSCMSSCLLGRGTVGLWQERRHLQRHWTQPTALRPSHSLRRPVCASASPSAEEEIIAALPPVPYSRHAWNWKGHNISWATAGCGKPIVLVHGFGASLDHYKRNFPVLAANYKVYALDLLGFGRSAKPVLPYTMEQWEELVVDFLGEFVEQPAVIVGNSLGSLTSLMVSASAPDRIAGTVLLNCAGGMNNKAISDDFRIKLAMPIFLLIDYLLAQPRVARYLFDRFRTKENIRQVLMNVYTGNPANVDQELVDMIYSASCDEGALEAFVSIMSGPPGPRPEQLIPKISTPMLVLWGTKDPFTPSDGPVGRYFQRLAEQRPGSVDFVHLPGVGHCPHDEAPDEVHEHLLPWLEKHHA